MVGFAVGSNLPARPNKFGRTPLNLMANEPFTDICEQCSNNY